MTPAAMFWQVLGNHVSLQAVESVLDGVKHHGSKGIEFPDFIDIMSRDSRDLTDDNHSQSNSSPTTAYNIALMARAYRCRSATKPQATSCMCLAWTTTHITATKSQRCAPHCHMQQTHLCSVLCTQVWDFRMWQEGDWSVCTSVWS